MPEGGVEDDIRGFPPDAGQRLQRGPVLGDPAAVLLQQDPAGPDDVFRLGVKKTDGADVLLEAVDAKCEDGLG